MNEYIIDTSIQIKRLLSREWKRKGLDILWIDVKPIVSAYLMMEFKNSFIRSIEYLISIIREIKMGCEVSDDRRYQKTTDQVKIRLEDVVRQLSETTQRMSDRKYKIILGVAAELLHEGNKYPRYLNPDEVIDRLKFYAEDLESHWFFTFPKNGTGVKAEMINTTKCYLSHNLSPLQDGNSLYKCIKAQYPCAICEYLDSNGARAINQVIMDKSTHIDSRKLRRGVFNYYSKLESNKIIKGRSLGQRICWAIGDAIIFSKCLNFKCGIFSADSDLRSFAIHFGIDYIHIDSDYSYHSKTSFNNKGN
jgi:hypothetical protein